MLKIGMVGMGGISRSHRAAWKQVEEAKIVCVCDIRPEMADAAAEDTGAKAYYDFDEMLAAEKFDILDICLPTYLHADFAVKAMDHGIHTLTEKPISLKKEDVARVYEAAKRNNVRFMVAHVLRFWREYMFLKDAIDTGRYGKLLSGQMTRLGNTPKWSWDNWMRDPERSGLVPFDLHIHDLDFMVYAFGKPNSVSCHRAGTATQDYINVVYQYDDFFIACESAWYDAEYKFASGFRFQFEEAVIEWKGGVFTVFKKGSGTETLEGEANANENGINLPATNAYFNEIRYFADQVLAGKDCDIVKPEELETVLELIDQLHN
ncbi:MAG: Gfo/Idh/MocA family oxidoreductase [Eubacteriales bacterium]|nr:Gfo/Idh/MocA family oxidoreductase [Eubacteriales bacterium]